MLGILVRILQIVARRIPDMTISPAFVDFTNYLLIAMPGMEDDIFAGSVVYVCQHSPNSATGLIVNKPADVQMTDLFRKLELPLARAELTGQTVLRGGPVQPERGFVLHAPMLAEGMSEGETAYVTTLRVPGGLEMTTSRDILEAIAAGGGPSRLMILLGNSVWGPGQLEAEMTRGSWLAVPADSQVIFATPVEQRYTRALGLLGLHPMTLAPQVGHA
jgi:putative transcriptional regulator